MRQPEVDAQSQFNTLIVIIRKTGRDRKGGQTFKETVRGKKAFLTA